jgi:hypothetical protein
MTTNNSIPTNEKETLNYIDDSADQLDEQRLSGLQEEQHTQLIKDEVLQREKKRLEAKHGNTHPEVQEAESRTAYNKEMFTGLNKEIEKASIKTEPLPENAWRVNGRVFDQNNKPVKGVTVFLSDQNKRWIEILGNSCTTELGYYSLTADEKVLDKIEKGKPLYLAVSDKNKKIIYFATAPIFAAKGSIDYQDIYLKDEDCTLPPIFDGREKQMPVDVWVVKGKVTDESNKGLKGLTVSLYDQDLFFDDALGTTLTNENGNFEIMYRTEAFKLLFEKKPDLYLKILDNKGKKLYTSENKIRPDAGRVEEFIIKIESNKK